MVQWVETTNQMSHRDRYIYIYMYISHPSVSSLSWSSVVVLEWGHSVIIDRLGHPIYAGVKPPRNGAHREPWKPRQMEIAYFNRITHYLYFGGYTARYPRCQITSLNVWIPWYIPSCVRWLTSRFLTSSQPGLSHCFYLCWSERIDPHILRFVRWNLPI